MKPGPIHDANAIICGIAFCSYDPVKIWDHGPLANTWTSSPPWVSESNGAAEGNV